MIARTQAHVGDRSGALSAVSGGRYGGVVNGMPGLFQMGMVVIMVLVVVLFMSQQRSKHRRQEHEDERLQEAPEDFHREQGKGAEGRADQNKDANP